MCSQSSENVFDYQPVTFMLSIPDGKIANLESSIRKFSLFFDVFEQEKYDIIRQYKSKKQNIDLQTFAQTIAAQDKKLMLKKGSSNISAQCIHKCTMPACHFIGGNLWVLKITFYNRGRGIHVFKSIKALRNILKSYASNQQADKRNC